MGLETIGEFGIIDRYARRLDRPSDRVLVGIGDDCAVLRPDSGRHLLVTSDMMVAGVHFLEEHTTPEDLGYKSLAASLSDIAAMGGEPLCFFVSLGPPASTEPSWVERFFNGMGNLSQRFNVPLAGGDTVRSERTVVDVTVAGQAEPGRILSRSGALPGDAVLVTGELGASAAGLALIVQGLAEGPLPGWVLHSAEKALLAHRRPMPRLNEAFVLAESGLVHSMMDISDGLAGDIAHVAAQSGVGAEIRVNSLPVPKWLSSIAALCKASAEEWSLYGGEDYELLLTAAPDAVERLQQALRGATGTNLTDVGHITDSPGVVMAETGVRLRSAHQHFGSPPS